MKKTTLAIALTLGISGAFAQTMKPIAGEMGISAGLSSGITGPVSGVGHTGTLAFKYIVKEDMVARVGVNFGKLPGNGTFVSDTSHLWIGGNGISQSTVKRSGLMWALSLGVQKSMNGTDKLDPYFGADIFFGGIAGQKNDSTTDFLKSGLTRSGGDYDKFVKSGMHTISYGIVGVIGFNYFFADHLAVGAEFGYGFESSTTKGGEVTFSDNRGGTKTTKTTKASPNAMETTGGFGVKGATITLSWFFGTM